MLQIILRIIVYPESRQCVNIFSNIPSMKHIRELITQVLVFLRESIHLLKTIIELSNLHDDHNSGIRRCSIGERIVLIL